jgi:16S rRNA (cytosine967-C5)-methyltransferase
MNEYLIVIDILLDVLSGKNLTESFTKYTSLNQEQINIGKIKDLSSGVIRYYSRFIIILNFLVKNKINNQKIFIVMLIAFYEINFTKKPKYSIVSSLVDLGFKITKDKGIKIFINGVLRNYLRNQESISDNFNNNPEYNYSIPLWWINKIKKDYPENYETILQTSNNIPKKFLRINNRKTNLVDYLKILEHNKINYQLIDEKIVITENLPIKEIPFFNEGYFSIQNISAQKLIDIANIKDDEKILDACCAPGGKLCQILENYEVELCGIDIDSKRLEKVKENFKRLDLYSTLLQGDSSNLNWWDGKLFDKIIADVPCSASGTLKRNPDIKLHRTLKDISNFVNLQRNIIQNLLNTLKVSGWLIYITCSIFKEENTQNIQYFLDNFKNLKMIKEDIISPDDYYDGFYYCILEKI